MTSEWGTDHGAWTLFCHLFPDAQVPVVQISLNQQFNLEQHWQLAQKLALLRSEGYLIVGSGNIVHNLRAMRMDGKLINGQLISINGSMIVSSKNNSID